MFTTAPDVTIDTTVGQVVVPSTATPTSTSSSTSEPGSTATPTASLSPSPSPSSIPTPNRRYRVGNSLSIYGYGPINAEVSLKGFGVSEKTVSDQTGFFIFDSIYSYTYSYPELCIQSVDNENR